jgi:hypothetical protein
MRVTYRRHAEDRMRERSVSKADVEHALKNYVERVSTPKNSVRYKGPGLDGRVLKVWVLPDRDPQDDKIVKSVAWEGAS